MALAKGGDCGGNVSTAADKCPYCGAAPPMPPVTKSATVYALVCVGCILALSGLNACGPAKPKITADTIEQIGLHGTCKEDQANVSAEYYAVAYRMRDRATGKIYSEGLAFRPPPSPEEEMRIAQHPEEYQAPHNVMFAGNLGDFHLDHLTLHGFASQKCPERAGDGDADQAPDCGLGYPAACELTVEKRGSKSELDAWMNARLGIPADLAKKMQAAP